MSSFFSWKLPTPLDHTKVHRKVSWLDLFFDLMYVLLFRDLFYLLKWDITVELFLSIFIYFVPIWLVRHWYNFYVQRFEESTLRHRVMTFVLMALVGIYSFSIHNFWLQPSTLLLYAWAWAHIVLWYMFISAVRYTGSQVITSIARKTWLSHMIFACFLLLWTLNVAFPVKDILLVSSLGYIVYLFSMPFLFTKIPKIHSEYLWERYWLFIIIVLAEMIYWLLSWLSDAPIFDMTVLQVSAWGFLMVVAIWWLYFDIIGHNPMNKRSMKYVTHRSLLHLPLSLSIIYLGWMFLHIIYQESTEILQTKLLFITWLLVIIIFLIVGFLSFFHEFEWNKHSKKLKLPKHLPWIAMIIEVILFSLLLWFLQISTPASLIYVLLGFIVLNIIWFHYFFDPLDTDESFE